MEGQGPDPSNKRVYRPTDMVTSRQIRVPVATDPSRLDVVYEHDCDVMMVDPETEDPGLEDSVIPDSFVTSHEIQAWRSLIPASPRLCMVSYGQHTWRRS